jgi:hypothetical protein
VTETNSIITSVSIRWLDYYSTFLSHSLVHCPRLVQQKEKKDKKKAFSSIAELLLVISNPIISRFSHSFSQLTKINELSCAILRCVSFSLLFAYINYKSLFNYLVVI